MKLSQNIKTFLKQLPLKNMNGEGVFVAIVFFLAKGKKDVEIESKTVKANWSKTLIGKTYNPGFAHRAQGYIDSCEKRKVCLTDEGIEYIESLIHSVPSSRTGLIVFKKESTHLFDKFLRGIFKKATKNVDITDTYVAGNIFDNLLDEVPKSTPIQFLYGSDTGGFVSKSKRFAREYNFQAKKSKQFHDRFIVVDGKGYIIGPSLKDAADKKPAILVILSDSDSKELAGLFSDLWS